MLWNVLHDGVIVGVEGTVPGNVRLTIEIPYLREMWADGGQRLIVDLTGCTMFEWRVLTDDQDIVFQDFTAIARARPEIRSAARINTTLHLHVRGMVQTRHGVPHPFWEVEGEIHMRYRELNVMLDDENTTPVSLEDVREKAALYWDQYR